MTKIMESDMWQVICLENSGEVCSHETWLDDFTNLIDIDVIKVRAIASCSVLLLT